MIDAARSIGSRDSETEPAPEGPSRDDVLRLIKDRMLGDFKDSRVMYKEGQVEFGGKTVYVNKALLDTGASSGSYVGQDLVDRFPGLHIEPCTHKVKLGDNKTEVHITQSVVLNVALYDSESKLCDYVATELYVMPNLGAEIIIGLPDILGNYYDFFIDILETARRGQRVEGLQRLQQIYGLCADQICRPDPSFRKLKHYAAEARRIGSSYAKQKQRIKNGVHTEVLQEHNGKTFSVLCSKRYGTAFADNRVEHLVEVVQDLRDFPIGQILDAWSLTPEVCPEEEETPDPVAMGEDVLRYMEMSNEDARAEYLELLDKQISPEMRAAVPRVMDIMTSPAALETFSPSAWNGLKVPPINFETAPGMPTSMPVKSRPIRQDLYAHARKEFDRLVQYFYENDRDRCTSAIASPLVIAPKATSPYIRFCGDYRAINEFITIPKHPIPVVQHELTKASQFKVFVDLDMTNSFHQIPLSEESSNLLSVQTPWGLVRPKFLPEGVGPASGILQSIVKDIFDFQDFPDWTIVIFDNFLVLANDYEDAANKLERVIARCAEFGVVLKIKKSFIGHEKVTFFGYEVTHGRWQLSDSRKEAIEALPFPKSKKEMQSFLGAALFFHNHIPDYSQWAAKLYETTHDGFSWDRSTWKFDYEEHFDKFKQHVKNACTLYFPRYDLPWVVRCDASEHAVGAILFQVHTNPDGTLEHQPIAFSSKRFSEPAQKWDAYKREAYAIYHSVHSFSWYLRGKEFLVETDHRNLQWIETSQSPIVCRWRALLQSFHFKIRHIPGRENKVADWMSRPALNLLHSCQYLCRECSAPGSCAPIRSTRPVQPSPTQSSPVQPSTTQSSPVQTGPVPRSVDSMLQEVHGGRNLHYGVYHTWSTAKRRFPDANISIEACRNFVRECPLCQKCRATGIKGLEARTLSLKPDSYRRTVGVDYVTITPVDENGNGCAILVVEHFSHFPTVYPAKDYTAETAAIALFKHYCSGGLFDQLAHDPGSAFMSAVVRQLNQWFGIYQKVSLVGRHQSNGCEGTGKQLLRHLTTLVLDTRLYNKWSSDTVLPWINFMLASYPTEETGGFTPFQLRYGTLDASYFRLPGTLTLENGVKPHQLIKALDENLQHIRSLSHKFQQLLAEERRKADANISSYVKGDLILFNPREKPSDHLPTKLSPNWLGPYQVISQEKNDVRVKHIVLHSEAVFHVDRIKPFIGSYEQALEIARHDQHQYRIESINYFTGNPFVRSSMTFHVLFEDGAITMPYAEDLAQSQQFEEFVLAHPILFPLRHTAKQALVEISKINKLAIDGFQPGDNAYLDLRFYDGRSSSWFDSLNLPHSTSDIPVSANLMYVTPVTFTRWLNNKHTEIEARVPFWGPDSMIRLKPYDIQSCVHSQFLPSHQVLVDHRSRQQFQHLLDA